MRTGCASRGRLTVIIKGHRLETVALWLMGMKPIEISRKLGISRQLVNCRLGIKRGRGSLVLWREKILKRYAEEGGI